MGGDRGVVHPCVQRPAVPHVGRDPAPYVHEYDRALNTSDPIQALVDYDNINCRAKHGLPLPGSPPMSNDAYHALYLAWNKLGVALFNGSAFGLGPFFQTLLDNMQAVISGNAPMPKFMLFSGHDTSVGPLLAALCFPRLSRAVCQLVHKGCLRAHLVPGGCCCRPWLLRLLWLFHVFRDPLQVHSHQLRTSLQ